MTNAVPPDGCEILDDIYTVIRRFCVLPGEHEYMAVTLWCAYTHFADAFEYAPRLIARSPHKRSGKTGLLEVVAELVRGPLRAMNVSTSYIFRSIEKNPRQTLLLDEVDALFGAKANAAQHEDLRALLNAGFQRGNPVGRTTGPDHTPTEFQTFAPAAMAGIGRLPDTIEDRAVVIHMRRRTTDEKVLPYRPGRDNGLLHSLRSLLASWAERGTPEAYSYANGDQRVDLPVDDRAADLWEPLIVVAEIAGRDWPRYAREACRALTAQADEDDTDTSPGQQLLTDIRAAFTAEFMSSEELCSALRAIPESPWSDFQLNPSKLGRRLREYRIKSGHSTDKKRRGYRRADFADAFSRYIPEIRPKASKPSGVPADQCKRQQAAPSVDTFTDGLDGSDTSDEPQASRENARSTRMADSIDTFGRLDRNEWSVPGGATNSTPGMTDRVRRALEHARAHTAKTPERIAQ
ncbi:DUF3631 domain-containing protein [Mycobacterium marinum]|uniref:DUF3631 domain-containing protein n=1 Tax=Mycobacterium marinum TaxID=1781 RepID=UPI00356754F2